jgi:AMMECR1 domain-containing protein
LRHATLISRRALLSTGVAAGTAAVLQKASLSLAGSRELVDSFTDSTATNDFAGKAESFGKNPYSTAERAKILKLARYALSKLFDGETTGNLQSDADRLGIPAVEQVNISLRHEGKIRGSGAWPAENLGRQIAESTFRAAMDRRFGGPLTRWELPDAVIEVWLQIGSSEIAPETRVEDNLFLLGIEGVEIEGRGKSAYFKPSVPITSKYRNKKTLLEALCKKAGLEPDAWQQADVKLRKTQWICLSSANGDRFFGPALRSKDKLPFPPDRCIAESVSYLLRNQDVSGATAYLYDPISDLFIQTKRTNLVRAAGCLFALSQVLESDQRLVDKKVLKPCAVHMARGLLDRTFVTGDGRRMIQEEKIVRTTEENESFGDQIEEGESAKKRAEQEERLKEIPEQDDTPPVPAAIGATALFAAAMGGDTLRKEFPKEYQQLYLSIACAQKPDGRMATSFEQVVENEKEVNFYSGEALLVFALEAERGNKSALELCRRAFKPYVSHFRNAPTTAFVGWHVNVWSRIASVTEGPAYSDFVFELTDWLLQIQIRDNPDPRWIGGFSQSGAPPQCYANFFLEAAARALALAHKLGDVERTKKYADCVRLGLQFCNRLRLEETPVTLLANPLRCKGGIAFGLTDRRIRCDTVQHFITLCLVVGQIKGHLCY